MRVISITKTHKGEEFAIASLESIYNYMYKIVYVHSNINWLGEKSANTVAPLIEAWKKEHDRDNKIINLYLDTKSQEEQYGHGLQYIHMNFHYDFKMFIDTDEVWENSMLIRALATLDPQGTANAYRCNMYSYIKSPFFRTQEFDTLCPVVFVKTGSGYQGVRGCKTQPETMLPSVHFHHFCAVRKSLRDVLQKHKTSCGTESVAMVDSAEWVREKWNKLPTAMDLLPIKNHEHQWHAIKVVQLTELPETCRDLPIVQAFQKALPFSRKLKLDKHPQVPWPSKLPLDFDESHALYKTPSYKNTYQRYLHDLAEAHAGATK